MKSLRSTLAFAMLATLAACGGQSDDRSETIVKAKILAVRAASPELHPGGVTRVDVLVGAPDAVTVTAFTIPIAQEMIGDYADGNADFRNAGVAWNFVTASTVVCPPIAAPLLPRCMPVDGVSAAAETPGVASTWYQAPVTPGTYTIAAFVKNGVPASLKPAQLQAELTASLKTLKGIVVRAAGEPLNRNPVPRGLTVEKRWRLNDPERNPYDRTPLEAGGLDGRDGELLRIKANFDDEDMERVSAYWFITAGSIQGYGRTDMDYRPPAKPGIVSLIAVLLDRTGGNNWWIQDFAVGLDELKPEAPAPEALLVESEGRLFWLGFAAGDTVATDVAAGLAAGPVVVEAEVVASPAYRLGWRLGDMAYAGALTEGTAGTLTAAQISESVPTGRVAVRLDRLVKRLP